MLSRIRGFVVLIQFSITVGIVIVLMYTFRNHTHKVIKGWNENSNVSSWNKIRTRG